MEPIPVTAYPSSTQSSIPVVKSYYAVPTWKFFLLTFLSVFYPTYWYWKNWTRIKEDTNGDFSPLLRALFSFIYLSDYAKAVLVSAKAKQYPGNYSPSTVAWINFISLVLALFGIRIAGLGFFVIIPVVQAMSYVNTHTEGTSLQLKPTIGEVVVVLAGIILWSALVISVFLTIATQGVIPQ